MDVECIRNLFFLQGFSVFNCYSITCAEINLLMIKNKHNYNINR